VGPALKAGAAAVASGLSLRTAMSVLQYLCVFVVVDVVFAVITCSDPGPLSMKVGEVKTLESTCVLPTECTHPWFRYTVPPGYPESPIVVKNLWLVTNSTVIYTFRGFDNMLGGKDSITQQFQWTVGCTANDSNTESQVMNFTVQMNRSDADKVALEPPTAIQIPADCLVEGIETPVLMSFQNVSVTYRELAGGWKAGDALPWVLSRPSGATRFTAQGKQDWDAESQPILKGIEAELDGLSLRLLLKPSDVASSSDSWKVCMIPGDGFNWFPEICTGQFAVRQSQEECNDMTTTTAISGGTSALPSLTGLLCGFACFLFACL
jgi:hypothetical protein